METAEQTNVAQLPAIRKPQEVRVVEDVIPVLDTARFEHMQRIAAAMSKCSLIPQTLRGDSDLVTAANCFLVVNQAVQWNMDPFQVAQCVSVINGRLMHEGKLIAAVIEAKLGIKLHKEWRGQGDSMSIVVSNPRDITECVTGTVAEWKTTRTGSPWVPKQYAKMLWYRGVREWCRMYAPGLILGIYSPDEEWESAPAAIEPPTPPEPPALAAPEPPPKTERAPDTDALGGNPEKDAIPPGLRRENKPDNRIYRTIPNAQNDPAGFAKWLDGRLAEFKCAAALSDYTNDTVIPMIEGVFPPIYEDVMGIVRSHEQRLAP